MMNEPNPFDLKDYLPLDEKGNLNFEHKSKEEIKKSEIVLDFLKHFCNDSFAKLNKEQKKELFSKFDEFVSKETNCSPVRIEILYDTSFGGQFTPDNGGVIFLGLDSKEEKNVASALLTYLHEKFHQLQVRLYNKAVQLIRNEYDKAMQLIQEERKEKGIENTPVFLLFNEEDRNIDPIVRKYGMQLRENVHKIFKKDHNMDEREFESFMCSGYLVNELNRYNKEKEVHSSVASIDNVLNILGKAYYTRPDEVAAYSYEYGMACHLKRAYKAMIKHSIINNRNKNRIGKKNFMMGYRSLCACKSSVWATIDTLHDEYAGDTYYIVANVKKYIHDKAYAAYKAEVNDYEKGHKKIHSYALECLR